jgi:hypothetical protein
MGKMSAAALKKALALIFTLSALLVPGAAGAAAAAADLHGFVEGAYGLKLGDERAEKNGYNLGEVRVQLKHLSFPEILDPLSGEIFFKGELLADAYDEEVRAAFRELNLFLRPVDNVDVKAGRQILTWGTGDFLFINDLFPKDYVSFFTGREDEYLKLPSDALRLWLFLEAASVDLVLIPEFRPNNSIRGDRLSFYDGLTNSIIGEEAERVFFERAVSTENIEAALRVYRTIRSYEAAFYLFNGFYKEPRGILDASREEFFYPRLRVYGFSLRGPVLGGIGNIEAGFYDSLNDPTGRDGSVENSSIKYLVGFSRELGVDFKMGLQYMTEVMLQYDGYRGSVSPATPLRDEFRHLLTLRLTRLLLNQTLEAGLFAFYSPSDRDAYLRPVVGYKATDNLKLTVGVNIFTGSLDHTDFGSLEGNNNVYLRARYTF